MLDHENLQKMYGKAYKRFIDWLIKRNKTNGSNFDIEINFINEINGTYLNYHMRDLFDFFDDNKIHIEIYKQHILGEKKHEIKWCFDCGVLISKGYGSRRYAEWAAFKQGFRILNKKLS